MTGGDKWWQKLLIVPCGLALVVIVIVADCVKYVTDKFNRLKEYVRRLVR